MFQKNLLNNMVKFQILMILSLFAAVECKSQKTYIKVDYITNMYSDNYGHAIFLIEAPNELLQEQNKLRYLINKPTYFVQLINDYDKRIYFTEDILRNLIVFNRHYYEDSLREDQNYRQVLHEKYKQFNFYVSNNSYCDTILEYRNGTSRPYLRLSLINLVDIPTKKAIIGVERKCMNFYVNNDSNIVSTDSYKSTFTCNALVLFFK